jgi:hypothetical protein
MYTVSLHLLNYQSFAHRALREFPFAYTLKDEKSFKQNSASKMKQSFGDSKSVLHISSDGTLRLRAHAVRFFDSKIEVEFEAVSVGKLHDSNGSRLYVGVGKLGRSRLVCTERHIFIRTPSFIRGVLSFVRPKGADVGCIDCMDFEFGEGELLPSFFFLLRNESFVIDALSAPQ